MSVSKLDKAIVIERAMYRGIDETSPEFKSLVELRASLTEVFLEDAYVYALEVLRQRNQEEWMRQEKLDMMKDDAAYQ